LWSKINTAEMEEGTKAFVKEVKSLSKRVRMSFGGLCWYNHSTQQTLPPAAVTTSSTGAAIFACAVAGA
jgi:hypothetical protein